MKAIGPVGAALAAALLAIGCGEGGSSSASAGPSDAGRDTYEEHEHRVPAHKPPHFPEAVRQLEARHERLADALRGGPGPGLETQLAELRDIVRWLPELAVDGDLPRGEWDLVRAAAARVGAAYERIAPGVRGARVEVEPPLGDVAEEFGVFDEVLRGFPDAFELRASAAGHDDDHHHHGPRSDGARPAMPEGD